MKSVSELFLKDDISLSKIKPDNIEKPKTHNINLFMNYNQGGKRGRKSEVERKRLSEECKFKIQRKDFIIEFD